MTVEAKLTAAGVTNGKRYDVIDSNKSLIKIVLDDGTIGERFIGAFTIIEDEKKENPVKEQHLIEMSQKTLGNLIRERDRSGSMPAEAYDELIEQLVKANKPLIALDLSVSMVSPMIDVTESMGGHLTIIDLSDNRASKTNRNNDVFRKGARGMDAIKVFDKSSDEYKKLEGAAKLIEAWTKRKCIVKETYFDIGQDWKWTTILMGTDEPFMPYGQLLSPKDQEAIVGYDIEKYMETVFNIIKKYC